MTSWQDQQPQSRRSLRESERAHTQGTASDTVDAQAVETDFGQDVWQEAPQPFAPAPPSQVAPDLIEPDHHANAGTFGQEPLRRPRQSGAPRPDLDSGEPDAAYRLRDFAPESRGTSFSSTQSAPWTPPLPGSEDLHYRTSADANRRAKANESLATQRQSEAEAETTSAEPSADHTLTRRELREQRELQEARNAPAGVGIPGAVEAVATRSAAVQAEVELPDVAQPDVAQPGGERTEAVQPVDMEVEAAHPVAPVELVPPPVDVNLSRADGELAAAMAEFDKLFQNEPKAFPSANQDFQPPVPAPEPTEVKDSASEPAAPVSFDWQFPQAQQVVDAELGEEPQQAEADELLNAVQEVAAAQQIEADQLWAEHEVGEPIARPEPLREVVTAPEVYSAPAGHWSTQPVLDEDAVSATHPHQRDIASSDAITTSALVLPSYPVSMPTTGPVAGTGEILMTGSIALPRSLGVNGLHPSRYDRPDIDEIIDAADRENAAPDSAPVRAVRAVSTYTSSQGLINAKRPKGNNLPMVLSITAGVMMVGVVVLVVAGMIFKIF